MEELMRFVAIRAPELVEPDDERAIPLEGSREFQVQIAQTAPEERPALARDFSESENFVAEPAAHPFGRDLLAALEGVDLNAVTAQTLAEQILDALAADSDEDTLDALRALVERDDWQGFRARLADSLLALSLFQPESVRSTRRHEKVMRLMNFAERTARRGFEAVNPQTSLHAALATRLQLGPEAPRPEHEGEEPDPDQREDPKARTVRDMRRVNRAAEYLLSVPRAKLEPVVEDFEEEPPVVLRRGDDDRPNLTRGPNDGRATDNIGFSGQRLTYSLKSAVLEEMEPEVRQTITQQMETLGLNDVHAATMALRHDEREFYADVLPIKGTRIGGTTLTLANATLAATSVVRDALDLVLNPGIALNPGLLGPDDIGALLAPRFGRLGIGELLVVRQNLKEYRALDVAHIENILQGEKKEREHRRKRLTEETFFTETETELEEEREHQTSERFELRSEVTEEVKETFKFEAGVKVTAQLGPFVELEADARFGYENAKTEGRTKATQFSKETTERASTRFSERVLERRERRLVEEVEEINRHSIDATGVDHNIAGVYQWVNKVYEAQVYNYGIREMYEFFLPEPANFYIGSLVSKSMADGEKPSPPPPFNISPATLNRSNYKYYTALYGASGVPEPPEEYVKVDLAQAGGPIDFDSSEKGQVANAFSVQLPDGYEYFGYRYSSRYSYRGDDYDFVVSVSEEFGDPGTVPVWVKGRSILSWAVWVHLTCRVTDTFMDAWRLSAWETMRDGHAQMQREYEEELAAAAVQEGVEITGRNPAANERIIREEIQRQCLSAFTNQTPAGNNGVSGDPGSVTVNWTFAYKKGLYARFMHQAFEWENVSYIFYPFFWARKNRWLELFNIEDVDPNFQSFLQAGIVRVVVPVRPGFEAHVEHFRRTGEIWSGAEPPAIGDPDFLSVAAEIQAATGAPGDEEPVGDPWDIILPTPLVYLRADNQLPEWEKNVDDEWVEVEEPGEGGDDPILDEPHG